MKTLDEEEEDVTSSAAELLEEGEELLGVRSQTPPSSAVILQPCV